METSGWQAQLRKGASELVVLAVLADGERYGLQILEAANGPGGLIAEGALYPLLNRLEREGKIIARWSLDDGARHPRKYYRLSPAGEGLLAEMCVIWVEFRTNMEKVVESPR